jgi:hypothetical protein
MMAINSIYSFLFLPDFPSGRCVANGQRNTASPSATVVPERWVPKYQIPEYLCLLAFVFVFVFVFLRQGFSA